MNIKILYDNEALEGFQSGWGFSALIDDNILFDTGDNPVSLLENMQTLGIKPKQIKHVILSHNDWDHVGGIVILKQCEKINIYVPTNTASSLKDEIMSINHNAVIFEVDNDTDIASDKIVTATLGGRKKEVSLAVKTERGVVLITGCAHPGLDNIMKHTSNIGDIYAVVGGFHGFKNLKALADIPVIIPCHCTKKKNEILKMYPDQASAAAAGMSFDI
ncbi:MAG: MBL fold metallo-hydrolase [Kiritimatiellae bacterium]|nr:MBL fold metallo-hydrolase [Kiritimatiellia bacterium]